MEYTVGQKLWWVGNNNSRGKEEVTVTKIGNKWVYLSNDHRINAEGNADGGQYMSPGRVWESEEVYRNDTWRREAWDKLKRKMEYGRIPNDFTVEQGEQLLKQWGYNEL